MTDFPPPPPTQSPATRERRRLPVGRILLVLLVASVIIAIVRPKKDDNTETARDRRTESMRVAWNGLTASEQHDICASVNLQGVDVTADQIQEAASEFSGAAHDDVVWFLEEMACP